MKKLAHIFSLELDDYKDRGIKAILFLFFFVATFGIFIAYRYQIDPSFYHSQAGQPVLFSFLFYPLAYFSALGLILLFFGKVRVLLQIEFWVLSVVLLFILYLNHFHPLFPTQEYPYPAQSFLQGISYNFQCTIFYALPPILFWFLYYRTREKSWNGFGFNYRKRELYPYFGLLIFMIPLLLWASFRTDFQASYPRYLPGEMESYYQISPVISVSVFEFSYITQFITLEWFFRGFMVLSLSRFLGGQAVWLMVAVYVFLHFEKPMHETIGSFFGAYILGTISYHTQSIYGGMIVHVGIALLMELFAGLW